MKTATLTQDTQQPWWSHLAFPYDPELKDYVKSLPGVKGLAAFDYEHKTWRVPTSYTECLRDVFESEGYQFYTRPADPRQVDLSNAGDIPLKDYQVEAVQRMVSPQGARRTILAHITGAGKTVSSIAALRVLNPSRALIVCPSIAKYNWQRELKRWWPSHPHAEVIRYGRNRKLSIKQTIMRDAAYMAPVQVVGYSMLNEVALAAWDVIIFDEAHSLIRPSSTQYQAALALTEANPAAYVWMLTATLAPTEPLQVYGPLSVLQPDCWGRLVKSGTYSFDFNKRYANGTLNEHGGWDWEGLNTAHADELASRMTTCVHRVTHISAPITHTEVLPVDVTGVKLSGNSREAIDSALEAAGHKKTRAVQEWVAGVRALKPYALVFTWHRSVAEEIARIVPDSTCIHGAQTAEARLNSIDAMRQAGHGTLVCTMASVGIAIDLGFFEDVCFGELYSRAERIIQAMGRVGGMRSKYGAKCTFLVARDSVDERIGFKLHERLSGIEQLLDADDASKALTQLDPRGSMDAQLDALLFDEELNTLGDMLE